MTQSPSPAQLSRRERQIMDVIYQCGEISAAEVMEAIPDPPGYSAVRAMLRILENKGYLTHQREGLKYMFKPTVGREIARRSAIKQLVKTFFEGSVEQAVAALLDESSSKLTTDEWKRLAQRIEEARKEGK